MAARFRVSSDAARRSEGALLRRRAEERLQLGDRSAPEVSALRADTVSDPRAAVGRARALAGPGGAVLATGSIYLVADLVREQPIARASIL